MHRSLAPITGTVSSLGQTTALPSAVARNAYGKNTLTKVGLTKVGSAKNGFAKNGL